MDRDTFIITVYCLVVEHYAVVASLFKPRHGGFQPALTDEEVITMEICGDFFKLRPPTSGIINIELSGKS